MQAYTTNSLWLSEVQYERLVTFAILKKLVRICICTRLVSGLTELRPKVAVAANHGVIVVDLEVICSFRDLPSFVVQIEAWAFRI